MAKPMIVWRCPECGSYYTDNGACEDTDMRDGCAGHETMLHQWCALETIPVVPASEQDRLIKAVRVYQEERGMAALADNPGWEQKAFDQMMAVVNGVAQSFKAPRSSH